MKLAIEVQPRPNERYRQLILDKKIKVAVKRFNPMFHKKNDHGLPFHFPSCPINDEIFNHAHRLENANYEYVEMPFRMKFYGVIQNEGTIIIEESEDYGYEANLRIDRGNFVSEIKNKKMNALLYGGGKKLAERNDAYSIALEKLSESAKLSWPEKEYAVFPFYAPKLYWNSKNQPLANNWMWDKQVMDFSDQDAPHFRVPYFVFLYLNTVLKYIFIEHGYSITESFFFQEELSKLVLFNSKGGSSHELNYADCVPDVLITKFIKAIESLFNVTCFFNNKKKEVKILSKQAVIKSTKYNDITHLASKKHRITHKKENGFVLRQKRPGDDWNKSELENFNEFWLWDVGKFGDDFVKTFEDLPAPETSSGFRAYFVIAEGNMYTSQETGNEDENGNKTYKWEKHTDMQCDISEGNEDFEIETDATTLCMHEHKTEIAYNAYHGSNVNGYQIRLMPRTDIEKHNKDIRLLFYRGLQLDRKDPDFWATSLFWNVSAYDNYSEEEKRGMREMRAMYPFANNNIYNAYGEKLADAEHSLSWDGEHGLYKKYFKDFIFWYLNVKKEVSKQIDFTPADLGELDFSEKHRIGNQNYLISEVPVVYHANHIEVGESMLFTC